MHGRRNPWAVLGAVWAMALYANFAWALDAATVDSAAATQSASTSAGSGAATGTEDNEAETPDSVEQGHTQMPDSFDRRPIAALLHESRLVGLRDTTFNVQLRTYEPRPLLISTAPIAKPGPWAARRDSRPVTSRISLRSVRPDTPRSGSMDRWTRTARSCCRPDRSPTP